MQRKIAREASLMAMKNSYKVQYDKQKRTNAHSGVHRKSQQMKDRDYNCNLQHKSKRDQSGTTP